MQYLVQVVAGACRVDEVFYKVLNALKSAELYCLPCSESTTNKLALHRRASNICDLYSNVTIDTGIEVTAVRK